MSEQTANFGVREWLGRVAVGSAQVACGAVLAIALGLRLWSALTHRYVVFPDETFQYLEPAHRLAFGAGVVTWEYIEGIRSWLVPGLLAGIMRVADLFGAEPDAYVGAIRLVCVVLSLTVPYLAFRWGKLRHGEVAGVAAGLLCAFWYELIYYAPVILTETLAAHCALWALWLGEARAPTRRILLATGALFGLAVCIRYQYAPALAVAAVCQHGRRRDNLLPLCAAAAAVALVLCGLLDWITWGAPFQSVWLNFQRNALDGISAAMGAEPWHYPFDFFLAAWGPAAWVLIVLAALGAVQAPALAAAAMVTLVAHALTPHKEVRFLYLAIAAAPMLIGLGVGRLVAGLPDPGARWAGAVVIACVLAGSEAICAYSGGTPVDAWHRDRSIIAAFAAARAEPGFCGLGVRTAWVYRSGGYTYLHRSVPIYFETAEAMQHVEGSRFELPLRVENDRRTVAQHSGPALAENARSFNVLIGTPADVLPGYTAQACFGAGTKDDPTYCVFRRAGPCDQ